MLDAVAAAFVEQALRTCEPSSGLRTVGGVVEEGKGHPERASCRANRVAPLQKAGVRPCAGIRAGRVFANQIRSGGQTVEVVRVERGAAVCRNQLTVGVGPAFPIEGCPSTGQRAGRVHRAYHPPVHKDVLLPGRHGHS